jgi:hypothetical protein
VLHDYRGRGLGSRLVRHAEEQLTVLGCPKINLQIMNGNEKAESFYRKLWYEAERRVSMGKKVLGNISSAEPRASPAGHPEMPADNSGAAEGPPSAG